METLAWIVTPSLEGPVHWAWWISVLLPLVSAVLCVWWIFWRDLMKEFFRKVWNALRIRGANYLISRGLCPQCGSRTPALVTCKVCDSYRPHYGTFESPPSAERKAQWLKRWVEANT